MRPAIGMCALALLCVGLLPGCGRDAPQPAGPDGLSAPAGTDAYVNPGLGSTGAPIVVQARDLPLTSSISEGSDYFHVVGLPANVPFHVGLLAKRADADVFVLGDPAFVQYQCGSTVGGPADDLCETGTVAGGELYIEVQGYRGNDTEFILDIW
jgi:hypothetical protein